MPWSPDYCEVADLKDWLRITVASDDDPLAVAIATASRNVDTYCGRQFGNITVAAARYETWDGRQLVGRDALAVTDIYTTDGLVVALDTDGDGDTDVTLTNGTDFDLYPFNAAADSVPWTHLVMRTGSASRLTCSPRGVSVTAKYGWTAIPDAVTQATIILAAEIFARRNAPFGIAGSPELGSEMRLLDKVDPDAKTALRRYVRSAPGGWVAA